MASNQLENPQIAEDAPIFPLPPKGHALNLGLAGREPTAAEAKVFGLYEGAITRDLFKRLIAAEGGKALKQLRQERKLTQVAMAKVLGTSEYYVYRLENGKTAMTDSMLSKIAKWLKTTEDERLRQLRLRAKMLWPTDRPPEN